MDRRTDRDKDKDGSTNGFADVTVGNRGTQNVFEIVGSEPKPEDLHKKHLYSFSDTNGKSRCTGPTLKSSTIAVSTLDFGDMIHDPKTRLFLLQFLHFVSAEDF